MPIKNQKGLSILEVTVAMGLLGIVSLGLMRMMENMGKGVRNTKKRVSLQDFTNSLKNQVIGRIKDCTLNAEKAFAGQGLDTSTMSINGKAGYKDIYKINPDGTQEKWFSAGELVNNKEFKVSEIKYRISNVETIPSSTTYTHKGQMNVVYTVAYCQSGGPLDDCKGISRIPSKLPVVEVLLDMTSGTVSSAPGGIRCQTLDTPLLTESKDYTDQVKIELCEAEKKIIALTGQAGTTSCGEYVTPPPGSVVDVWQKDDGTLTTQLQYDYWESSCNCCGKKCGCTPASCPTGYAQYDSKREKTCAATDPTCCGLKRRMTERRYCRKEKPKSGHVINL